MPAISLQLTIFVDPSNSSAFLKALRPIHAAVLAEPECTSFEVFESSSTPGTFRLVEVFEADLEWLYTVQAKREYFKPFIQTIEPMYIKPRVVEVFHKADMGKQETVGGKSVT